MPAGRARLTAWDTASASALAASADQPVEVMSDRTDYSQTFADPNGGFTLDESVSPVRVQQSDGSWVPIDTTLAQQSGGTYAPAAITAGLTLSGGGSGPLYTLSQGGESMSVSWPDGPLPAPSVSGSTATYADVLPGVNLLVSATPTGVSELLEVTSAAAAANPALAQLTFPVSVQGLSLSSDSTGVLSAADSSGSVVFTAPPSQMWDSAGSQAPGGPVQGLSGLSGQERADLSGPQQDTADGSGGPVPGDHMAVMPVTASDDSVSITPSQSVLTGASTVYPVLIDPEVNTSDPNSWSDVAKNGAGSTWGDWEYQDANFGGIRAGVECQPDSNGNCLDSRDSTWVTYRSYLNFNVPHEIWDSGYVDAQLQTNMEWAWSCSPGTQVNLYYANAATQGMTWPGPSEKGLLDTSTRAYRTGDSSCPKNSVNFDATGALRSAANNHDKSITLELRANNSDESNWNVYSWRRFAESSMNLEIAYRHAPDTPTNPGTENVFNPGTGQFYTHCATSAPGDYTSAASPVMDATIDDSRDYQNNVPVGNILGEFNWQGVTGSGSNNTFQSATYTSPPHTFTAAPTWTVNNGATYRWQAYGQTEDYTDPIGNNAGHLTGPTTGWCYYTDDTSPPSTAATITSVADSAGHKYVSGQATNPVGTPAAFTFTDPGNADPSEGVNDVAGYYYGLNNSNPSIYVPAGTDASRTATVTIAPFSPTQLSLYVQPVDRAGNLGPVGSPFLIDTTRNGPVATLGWWKLNEGSGGTAADSTLGNIATLSPHGASLGCGTAGPDGYSCTLGLNGTAGEADTALPVAGNDGSFSVSAWVYLGSTGSGNQAAISQGGLKTSGFTLGYAGSCGCWAFTMPSSDSASPATVYQAQSTTSAKPNTWTQLTGVFDATHGELLLYVNGGDGTTAGNGQPAGHAPANWPTAQASPWTAPAMGVLRFGVDGPASQSQDFWNGQLSGACAFYGALASTDVQALWAGGSADGCAALFKTYP